MFTVDKVDRDMFLFLLEDNSYCDFLFEKLRKNGFIIGGCIA